MLLYSLFGLAGLGLALLAGFGLYTEIVTPGGTNDELYGFAMAFLMEPSGPVLRVVVWATLLLSLGLLIKGPARVRTRIGLWYALVIVSWGLSTAFVPKPKNMQYLEPNLVGAAAEFLFVLPVLFVPAYWLITWTVRRKGREVELSG